MQPIFVIQTINSVRSNNLSLKYQRFTPSDCKDVLVRKFEFVAKTQFPSNISILSFCNLSCNTDQEEEGLKDF